MRITSAVAAGSLIVALSSPFAWAQGPVEQLLIDVNELHATYTDTLDAQLDDIRAAEEAEDEDALVEAQDAYRATLKEWRIDLIDAADELAELREGAESKADAPTSDAAGSGSRSTATSLSKQERKAFEEAEDAIKQDRATVRELRADVLGDDEAIYLPGVLGNAEEPGALGGLGGLLGTTASDAIERSEQGDKRIVFGLPESDEHADANADTAADATTDAAPRTEVKAPSEPTSERTTPEATETDAASAEDAATSAEDSAPRPYYRAEVMQDNDEDSTTESSTESSTASSTSSSAGETTTGTSASESSSAAETTTGTSTSGSSSSETTSATAILQNRTTSASSSSSSSTVTRTTSSTRTSVDDDDEEETRDGDLAETGTPMRNLLVLAALLTLAGVFLVRRPA